MRRGEGDVTFRYNPMGCHDMSGKTEMRSPEKEEQAAAGIVIWCNQNRPRCSLYARTHAMPSSSATVMHTTSTHTDSAVKSASVNASDALCICAKRLHLDMYRMSCATAHSHREPVLCARYLGVFAERLLSAISNWYLSGFVRGANLALKLRCRLDLTASVRVCQQMGQGSPSF